jgi:capsular polysaccharide transport system permease protein
MATVVAPTLAATTYFGFVASDVYVSEAHFVVRSPMRAAPSGLFGALMQGTGFTRAQDDTYSVHDYIVSRDALRELDDELGVRAAFSATTIDRPSRFPALDFDDSFEGLHRFFQKRVTIEYDPATSISVLRVAAFDPQMAQRMNAMLLQMGERLVNRLNERGQNDLLDHARAQVAEAKRQAREAAGALAAYRTAHQLFDPDRQSAMQLAQVSRMQEELAATRAQIEQVREVSPDNPQLSTLRARERAMQREIAEQTTRVTGAGDGSLSAKAAEYQRLAVEQAAADRQLASALAAMETARGEAQRKQLYLERIALPSRPDAAAEPRRIRAVIVTLASGLLLWAMLSLLAAGVREHRD